MPVPHIIQPLLTERSVNSYTFIRISSFCPFLKILQEVSRNNLELLGSKLYYILTGFIRLFSQGSIALYDLPHFKSPFFPYSTV